MVWYTITRFLLRLINKKKITILVHPCTWSNVHSQKVELSLKIPNDIFLEVLLLILLFLFIIDFISHFYLICHFHLVSTPTKWLFISSSFSIIHCNLSFVNNDNNDKEHVCMHYTGICKMVLAPYIKLRNCRQNPRIRIRNLTIHIKS